MFYRQNKKDRRKENNKGFSLVELIVVIAIMAVLVAVLAPQFTKYIDQSRKSNDAATVSGIVTAAQVGIADTTNYSIPEDTYTITLSKSNPAVVAQGATQLTAGGATKNLADAIVETCGELSSLKITSSNWKNNNVNEIVVTVKYNNGAVTVTYTKDFADYVGGTATPAAQNPTPGQGG